jgi:hypothetical protein
LVRNKEFDEKCFQAKGVYSKNANSKTYGKRQLNSGILDTYNSSVIIAENTKNTKSTWHEGLCGNSVG